MDSCYKYQQNSQQTVYKVIQDQFADFNKIVIEFHYLGHS